MGTIAAEIILTKGAGAALDGLKKIKTIDKLLTTLDAPFEMRFLNDKVRTNASKFYRRIKIRLVNFDKQFSAHLKPAYLLNEKFRCVSPDIDVHIPKAITIGLRLRGVDVLTAQEDRAIALSDADLLDRATTLDRTLYSHDDDLLSEAHARLSLGRDFAGVIYSHQLTSPIGHCIEDLEIIAKTCEPVDMLNQIEFIPF